MALARAGGHVWSLEAGPADLWPGAPHTRTVLFPSRAAAERYISGAPPQVQLEYVSLWQRLERDPKPVAKKSWATLSPTTKRGYRGKMRTVFGLTTEAQYAEFYARANHEEMGVLRRKPYRGEAIARDKGVRPGIYHGGDEWATTWSMGGGDR